MKRTRLLAFPLVILALVGCKAKPIQGTVFIVTPLGESVKLGDVKVEIVSKSEILTLVDKARSEFHQAWESNQAALAQAQDELQSVTEQSEQFKAQHPFTSDPAYIALKAEHDRVQQQIAIYERMPVAAPRPAPVQYEPPTGNAAALFFKDVLAQPVVAPQHETPAVDLNKARNYAESLSGKMAAIASAYIKSNQDSIMPASARVGELTQANSKLSMSDAIAAISPTIIASTRTDAEGNFTLNRPKGGPYAIFATAETTLFDMRTAYFWIVDVVPGEHRIQLSNNNMVRLETNNATSLNPDKPRL